MKTGRGIASPFVDVEFAGCDYDNRNRYKTNTCSMHLSLLIVYLIMVVFEHSHLLLNIFSLNF